MLQISVVVPVYNEVDNLGPLIDRITHALSKREPTSWEAILVDDGSKDGTSSLMDELSPAHPNFRMVHFVANQGQTAAMDAGLRLARGQYIVTMDADLQNDPDDIETLMAAMTDEYDCVCGVRVKRQDNWIRLISSRIANSIRNWLSQETITDTGCSLKAFRRECFDRVQLFEGMHRFLPTLIKMEGYRVTEVPVKHHPRTAGISKYGVWNRLFKSFRDLMAVRWMKQRQLRYQIRNIEPALFADRLENSNIPRNHG